MRARDNPFAVEKLHVIRFRSQYLDWPEIMDRLVSLNYRAAVVGPEGSGKTTFLHEIANRLADTGFQARFIGLTRQKPRITSEERSCLGSSLGPGIIILLDGADLLSRFSWMRLRYQTRRARGLIIATHRTGLLPTLLECCASLNLLMEIVEELVGPSSDALKDDCERLFREREGNIREVLRDLYDMYAAGLASTGNIADRRNVWYSKA